MASDDQPSASAASTVAGCEPLAQHPQHGEITGAAAGNDPALRLLRQSGTIRAMASAVRAVSVAAPSAGDISRNLSEAKSLRSSDFGGGSAKNGCCSARATHAHVDRALRRRATFAIERLAHGAEHVIVEQRVAGTGIAGDQDVAAVDIGDVGNAADIEDDHRPFALKRLGERTVIDRNETARPARRRRRRRHGNRA